MGWGGWHSGSHRTPPHSRSESYSPGLLSPLASTSFPWGLVPSPREMRAWTGSLCFSPAKTADPLHACGVYWRCRGEGKGEIWGGLGGTTRQGAGEGGRDVAGAQICLFFQIALTLSITHKAKDSYSILVITNYSEMRGRGQCVSLTA